jgi:NADH dehydrogenase
MRQAAGSEVAVTVFRPSVIFGAGDSFLTLFAGLAALPVLPLAGADVEFQPVWVEDVARVMADSLARADTHNQTYELGGPEVFRASQDPVVSRFLKGEANPEELAEINRVQARQPGATASA